MLRRDFLRTAVSAAAVSALGGVSSRIFADETAPEAGPKISFDPVEEKDGWVWYDAATLPIEGRAWEDELRDAPFDRFPKRWMEKIPVRHLSTHSSGLCLRFVTNGPVKMTYDLRGGDLAMYHMPATGKSGFDLYGRDDAGRMRFCQMIQKGKTIDEEHAITLNTPIGKPENDGKREFMLYFPTYNGVNTLRLAVPKGKVFEAAPARKLKPILYYGTSIMQGGCSSRCSTCAPAIVGRRLDLEHWNFGFSGSGKMEPVMAEAFAELDPSVYCLDCNWNMSPDLIHERLVPFVHRLREAHPETPILCVEGYKPPYPYAWAGHEGQRDARGQANWEEYQKLKEEGVKNLWYLDADSQMPEDGEGTVDNCHATDYGFFVQANAYEKVLREILNL